MKKSLFIVGSVLLAQITFGQMNYPTTKKIDHNTATCLSLVRRRVNHTRGALIGGSLY